MLYVLNSNQKVLQVYVRVLTFFEEVKVNTRAVKICYIYAINYLKLIDFFALGLFIGEWIER
jgi:hypothetical protein